METTRAGPAGPLAHRDLNTAGLVLNGDVEYSLTKLLREVTQASRVLTVTGDKVTEIRSVSDRLGLFLQLGWDWPARPEQ